MELFFIRRPMKLKKMIPSYEIDLDKEPEYRWTHIVEDHRDKIKGLSEKIDHEILTKLGKFNFYVVFPIFLTLINFFSFIFPGEYYREMQGLSKVSGIPLKKIMQMNLGYDFLARCTSALIYDREKNKVFHLRTMDWDTDILRDLTINVKFKRDGEVVYEAVTWLFFVGIMTGCSHKNFETVSLNFRKTDRPIIINVIKFFFGYDFISFYIRDILSGPYTKRALLIAPSYITYSNLRGMIIKAFGSDPYDETYLYEEDQDGLKPNILVVSNHDHDVYNINPAWADGDFLLLNSIERKKECIKAIKNMPEYSVEECFKVMEVEPVKNHMTVYTVIMKFDIGQQKIEMHYKLN